MIGRKDAAGAVSALLYCALARWTHAGQLVGSAKLPRTCWRRQCERICRRKQSSFASHVGIFYRSEGWASTDWECNDGTYFLAACTERETHGWYPVKRLHTDICEHPLSRNLGAMSLMSNAFGTQSILRACFPIVASYECST